MSIDLLIKQLEGNLRFRTPATALWSKMCNFCLTKNTATEQISERKNHWRSVCPNCKTAIMERLNEHRQLAH